MSHDSRIISLAGILSEKKKLSAVKTKWSPPEGFFSQSATEIVKGLLAAPGGHAKAMSRLNFYINRAGKNLEGKDKARLDSAKDKLSSKLTAIKEELAYMAHAAGVVVAEKKKSSDDEDPEMDLPDETPAKAKKDDDEEETLPKIVLKIAKKAVGKKEEELADLLMKVYESGFNDGVKSTEDKPKKDKKDDKEEVEESAVNEGVMRLTVNGSDLAADAWSRVRKNMVNHAIEHLNKELSEEGNEYNTHGPLNVAMILVEKFDDEDFHYSPKLVTLGEKTLRLLEKHPEWRGAPGYSNILKKLTIIVGGSRKFQELRKASKSK